MTKRIVSKGEITKVEASDSTTEAEGRSHVVHAVTSRGVLFSIATNSPELFNVGDWCEVWGACLAFPGMRVYGKTWEGVQVANCRWGKGEAAPDAFFSSQDTVQGTPEAKTSCQAELAPVEYSHMEGEGDDALAVYTPKAPPATGGLLIPEDSPAAEALTEGARPIASPDFSDVERRFMTRGMKAHLVSGYPEMVPGAEGRRFVCIDEMSEFGPEQWDALRQIASDPNRQAWKARHLGKHYGMGPEKFAKMVSTDPSPPSRIERMFKDPKEAMLSGIRCGKTEMLADQVRFAQSGDAAEALLSCCPELGRRLAEYRVDRSASKARKVADSLLVLLDGKA